MIETITKCFLLIMYSFYGLCTLYNIFAKGSVGFSAFLGGMTTMHAVILIMRRESIEDK
jgi:hypothetical protein